MIRHIVLIYSGTTTGDMEMPDIKINMKDTNEPATATNPMNWRVIQEQFPNTNGTMDVLLCRCPFNLGN